jgi:TonB family protein
MGTNDIAEALGIPTGPSGLQSDDPYPLEMPIRVRGLAGGGNLGADNLCEPFLEDTLTVLVSPRGAVVRLAAQAAPGQLLTVSSPRLGREMPARVIRYRGHADVKGYAEIEFAPDAAIPGATTSSHLATTQASSASRRADAPHGQNSAATLAGAPLMITPLADLLDERPRARRSFEPLDPPLPPPKPAPASARNVPAKPRPQVKAAPRAQATVTTDLEALLATRKGEHANATEVPLADPAVLRSFEPFELTASAGPRRPRKRWLAIAAATLLTLGAAGTWAFVSSVPVMGALPEIAAFALPEPPAEIGTRNEVRLLPKMKFETETLPIATSLVPPARAALGQAPRAAAVKQRGAAEAFAAPEIRGAEVTPAGVAKPGLLGTLAPLTGSGAPAAPLPPVGGEVVQPRLISQAPVAYPQIARMTRAEGNVVIDARIDETGQVREMRIVSGPGVFHEAAKESLAKWRYQPALLNGKPVTTHLYVTIQFRR